MPCYTAVWCTVLSTVVGRMSRIVCFRATHLAAATSWLGTARNVSTIPLDYQAIVGLNASTYGWSAEHDMLPWGRRWVGTVWITLDSNCLYT